MIKLLKNEVNFKQLVHLYTRGDKISDQSSTTQNPGLFRRGVQSHAHAPTHMQKCLDVW